MSKIFFRENHKKVTRLQLIINGSIAFMVLVLIFYFSIKKIGIDLNFSVLIDFKGRIWQGFIMTIKLSIISLIFSLILGLLSAMGNNSSFLPISYLCKIYVQFIRGTPLIMQIYLFFYIIGTAWGVTNRFWSGVIILSIFEGAYISEIMRGGFQAIDSTQLEAAKSVGFDNKQTMKLVVLPQLVTKVLPALTGQFASIIKDSSLLSIISAIELTQTFREISATNFAMFECYIFLGILYMCLTLPLSTFTRWLEGKFRYEN